MKGQKLKGSGEMNPYSAAQRTGQRASTDTWCTINFLLISGIVHREMENIPEPEKRDKKRGIKRERENNNNIRGQNKKKQSTDERKRATHALQNVNGTDIFNLIITEKFIFVIQRKKY